MYDALDNLEVAKLAASLSGQLRRIDKETESSVPANRIDLRKFQQQVVNAANPNAARPVEFGAFQNQDEAQMLQYLNKDALNKIPELISYPTTPQHSVIPQEQIINTVQLTSDEKINQDDLKLKENSIDLNLEFLTIIRSIDDSLKQLCDYFCVSSCIKTKKSQIVKKTRQKIQKLKI